MSSSPPPREVTELWYLAVRSTQQQQQLCAHFTRLPFAVQDALANAALDRTLGLQFARSGQILSPLVEIDKSYQLADVYIALGAQRYNITKIVISFESGVASIFRVAVQNAQGARVTSGQTTHNLARMFLAFALADIFASHAFAFRGVRTHELLADARSVASVYNIDDVRLAYSESDDSSGTETQPPSPTGGDDDDDDDDDDATRDEREVIDVNWSD